MWASRESAGPEGGVQRRFQRQLAEPGRQIVLYGDTGVGKTSLVEHVVVSAEEVGLVRVECGPPLATMLQEALAAAGVGREEYEGTTTITGKGGVRADALIVHVGSERQDVDTTTTTTYPVSLATTVREALPRADVRVLFLDNFENVRSQSYGDELTRDIAQLMKSCADRGDLKVVVAGIPAESERLLLLDEATSRRTAEIEVPRMRDEELDEILQKGGVRLGLEFDADCRATILRYSDGFPYYTHLLALCASRAALEAGAARVTMDHFSYALGEVLDNADLSLKRAYTNAAETSGEVKVRKSIMQALATQEKTELTFREVRAAFQKIHRAYDLDSLGFINVGLGDLVGKYRVLQSRGRPKSPNRTYRFANPLMRTYVLLRARQDDPAA